MSQIHEIEFKMGDKSIKKNYLNLEWKPVNIFLFGMIFYISLLWAKGPTEDDINLLLNTLIKNYKGKSNRTIFIVLKKYKSQEKNLSFRFTFISYGYIS